MHLFKAQSLFSLVLALFTAKMAPANTFNEGGLSVPQISYEILTFRTSDFYQAVITQLDPVGRRLNTVNLETSHLASNDGDRLRHFQEGPLRKMLGDGYISQAQFNELLDWSALGIESKQITLITLYSDMPRALAEQLIPDLEEQGQRFSLASSRSIELEAARRADLVAQPDMVRVHRGSLYIIEGYLPQQDEDGKLVLKRRPLPFEKDSPLASGLQRVFNSRSQLMKVEIGRTMMHRGALAGDLKQAVHVAATYLANKGRALGIHPDQHLIFVHTLDPQHARLFLRQFKSAALVDAEIQTRLEEDAVQGMQFALAKPQPRSDAWQEHRNSLIVTSLRQLTQELPPEELSEAYQRLRNFGRERSYAEVQGFMQSSIGHLESFRFQYHPSEEATGTAVVSQRLPVVVRHLHDLAWWSPQVRWLFESGVTSRNFLPALDDLTELLQSAVIDLGLPERYDLFGWVYPLKLNRRGTSLEGLDQNGEYQGRGGFVLENIDPQMVEQYGSDYLGQLLAANYLRQEGLREGLLRAPHRDLLLTGFNHFRDDLGLPAVSSIDRHSYWESFPLFVMSDSPIVRQRLMSLGGTTYPGLTVTFEAETGKIEFKGRWDLKAKAELTELIQFSEPALERILRRHPKSTHSQLRPAFYRATTCVELAGVL